jgi:hypothetical protein
MTRPEPAAEKVCFEVIVVQQRLFIRSESREPGTPAITATSISVNGIFHRLRNSGIRYPGVQPL